MSPFPGFTNLAWEGIKITWKKWDANTQTFEDYLDEFASTMSRQFKAHLKEFYEKTPSESMALKKAEHILEDARLTQKMIEEMF